MPEFYLGTVSRPDIVKYYLMRRFKNVYFPQHESDINDDWFDLYYLSREPSHAIETTFKDFCSGFERGISGSFHS